MWTFLLTFISAILFFGFVAYSVTTFGLQDCYSAYGALWHKEYPPINIWSLVTFLTAVLLIPPILEVSADATWQAIAFFCPGLLIFVAATPDYEDDPFAHIVHGAAAGLSAIFAILFIALIAPALWPLPIIYILLATIAMFYFGKYSWMFWYEMAAYATIYTAMFALTL